MPRTGAWLGVGRGSALIGRPDLVEAGAAVDRPVTPRGEWDHGLATAGPADRGMELPGTVG
jgi:hypothetical protein